MNRIENLSKILSQGNLSLIDGFEQAFFAFISIKEISSNEGCKNRILVRNAYKAVIMLYGKEATLYHFYDILINHKSEGKKQITKLSRRTFKNPKVNRLKEDMTDYFFNTYYNPSKNYRTEYTDYAIARYIIETIIDEMEFKLDEYKDLSFDIITESK